MGHLFFVGNAIRPEVSNSRKGELVRQPSSPRPSGQQVRRIVRRLMSRLHVEHDIRHAGVLDDLNERSWRCNQPRCFARPAHVLDEALAATFFSEHRQNFASLRCQSHNAVWRFPLSHSFADHPYRQFEVKHVVRGGSVRNIKSPCRDLLNSAATDIGRPPI